MTSGLALATTDLNMVFVVAGAVIVLGTGSSVLRTLVVTRGLHSVIARILQGMPRTVLRLFARQFNSYPRRDSILSWVSPLGIVTMLLGWLVLFLVGYSLLTYGLFPLDFWDAVRQAGSSLFTLGFASGHLPDLTLIDFLAAATGPIVIGLMIGYLPTLYSAYNRREIAVSLLKSRAGEPSWGPELLTRATYVQALDDLPLVWRTWETWAADVTESHTTYPNLIYTRSSRPLRHWLISLLTVMDAAALTLALQPSRDQSGPRLLLRQGVECIREIARAINIDFDDDPGIEGTIGLTYDEFIEATEMLRSAGFVCERIDDDSWKFFQQWRRAYEEPAYKLAEHLDAVPALWSGPRTPPTKQIPPRPARYVFYDPDGAPRDIR